MTRTDGERICNCFDNQFNVWVIFQGKIVKNCQISADFSLSKEKNWLLFLFLHHGKLHIWVFWTFGRTEPDICRRQLCETLDSFFFSFSFAASQTKWLVEQVTGRLIGNENNRSQVATPLRENRQTRWMLVHFLLLAQTWDGFRFPKQEKRKSIETKPWTVLKINSSLKSFTKQKWRTFSGPGFSNVMIYWFFCSVLLDIEYFWDFWTITERGLLAFVPLRLVRAVSFSQ